MRIEQERDLTRMFSGILKPASQRSPQLFGGGYFILAWSFVFEQVVCHAFDRRREEPSLAAEVIRDEAMSHPDALTYVVYRDSFVGVRAEESDGSGQYQVTPTAVVCVNFRHPFSIPRIIAGIR